LSGGGEVVGGTQCQKCLITGGEGMEVVLAIIAIGSIIANVLITALNYKLYTEYWKDITIKRRYEDK